MYVHVCVYNNECCLGSDLSYTYTNNNNYCNYNNEKVAMEDYNIDVNLHQL